jgi:hypothetical protein
MFEREKYYFQTDVLKNYKISAKKFKQLLHKKNIPIKSLDANMGYCQLKTIYILKTDIDNLSLSVR